MGNLPFELYAKKKKLSPTAAEAAAAAAATAGHTRPGPASLYARLVDLTLEPFVRVLGL